MTHRKSTLIVAIVICAAAWLALAASIILGLDVRVRVTAVIVAAFASEALIWCTAAVVGLSAFEARRKIWRMRPFSQR